MPPDTSGGPLLTQTGKVVGIVGGSDRPGGRINPSVAGRIAFMTDGSPNSATPLSLVPESPSVPTTLPALMAAKTLTIPATSSQNFVSWRHHAAQFRSDSFGPLVTEFSRKDTIVVRSTWEKRTDQGKEPSETRIFDAQNRVIADAGSKNVSLEKLPTKYTVSLKLTTVPKGTYRVGHGVERPAGVANLRHDHRLAPTSPAVVPRASC